MKTVVIVDMQNDFINGVLGTKEAIIAVKNAKAFVTSLLEKEKINLLYTQDTHDKNYLNTQEGKNLPVPHCLYQTKGWEITPELDLLKLHPNVNKFKNLVKCSFGAKDLERAIRDFGVRDEDEFIVLGVCTDICVVTNVMLLKTFFPETKVSVVEKACAGVTPEKHNAAIETMKSCQVNII